MRSTVIVLGVQAAAIGALLTVALDQYAHKRVELVGGVNMWGYRGAVLPERQPRDVRVAIVGGDLAFGWGVAAGETVAAYLETLVSVQVQRPGDRGREVAVANLGAMGRPASQYAATVSHYAYLVPDLVCVYADLTDAHPHTVLPPAHSAVFRATGYAPILPLVLREKGAAWRGDGAFVRGVVVEMAGRVLDGADRTLARVVARPGEAGPGDRGEALGAAIDAALAVAAGVVVVLPTPRSRYEVEAHTRLLDAVAPRLATTPRLRLVDLAGHPRLADPALRVDGANFGAEGHSLTAAAMAPVVLDLLAAIGAL
jgi:hypothetical protein